MEPAIVGRDTNELAGGEVFMGLLDSETPQVELRFGGDSASINVNIC